ncbi:Ion transport 2 domain protein [Hydrogenobaculum sp. Y04AAS1]|uniref:ion channel n=1 Tax=Hydrogenobaculum sp. (strain Y04AAS1) TaxID=380749 RepID=UPI00015BCA15|nr:Ion transport 2 domain protein [Hydrogenobaculum sp. Y04AAS1]HCT66981.1 transporter [Hydrogenobaculum sp.]
MRLKTIKRFVFRMFEVPSSTAYKTYQPISIFVVLLSIVLGLLNEFHALHEDLYSMAFVFDFAASFVIAFEYISKLWLSSNFTKDFLKNKDEGIFIAFLKALKPKLLWMSKPSSIIDFISIFPIFHPLRLVRIVVLVARFFKISIQYKDLYKTLFTHITDIINEILGILVFIFISLASLIIILFSVEKNAHNPHMHNIFDAFYLAMITATTVGYGDITPITTVGRIVAILIALIGWFSFSIITAFVSSGLIRYINLLKTGGIIMADLKDHVIIAGWTETSSYMIEKLKHKKDKPLVVVISNQDLNLEGGFIYKKGDFVKEQVLKDVKIEFARQINIFPELFHDLDAESIDARSILTAVVARGLNKDIKINLQLLKIENAKTFRRRNIADDIIVSGEILGDMFLKDL